MPKRTNNEITSYKLKSGKKRWKFQTYLGLDDKGQKVSVTRQGFRTYNEAISEYNKLRAQGTQGYQKPKQIKVDEMYKLWFKSYKGQVKESTASKNLQVYTNHIKPIYGNQYMDKIKVKSVQEFADEKAQKLVKYKDVVRQLSTLYEYAIRLGYAKNNPVKRIIMPKKTSRPRRDIKHNVYTRKELNEFLEEAKHTNPRTYTYFKILASTGLRRSEALALTWKDIDLKNSKLQVNRTLAYGYNSKPIVQKPKSPMSHRTLPISPNLKKVLIKYKDYQHKQKPCSIKLFYTINGKWLALSKPAQWLDSIYKKNLSLKRITIHGFRHTFATLLINETNVKPKTVQMLMGHENIKMTMDIYTHITKTNKDDAKRSLKALNI